MSHERLYTLEEHVPHLVAATRSIGLEHGTDLILQLIYLRWDAENWNQGEQHGGD